MQHPATPRNPRPWRRLALAALCALAAIPAARAEAEASPASVNVVLPEPAPAEVVLELPGTVEPIEQATLYARIKGYVVERLVDLGDAVQTGQVLARIDAPEIDQDAERAAASVALAQARLELALLERGRAENLVRDGHVPRETVDARRAEARVREAELRVAQAELGRARALQDYKVITAPFAGIITARNIDRGDLVIGDTADADKSLFRLARTDELRTYVEVPQSDLARVTRGMQAELRFVELGAAVFTGRVVRTAGALDERSRTMRVEVRIANPGGSIPAGMLGQVRFTAGRGATTLLLPLNTLITRQGATFVAVVEAGEVVRFAAVAVGRDLGGRVEILQGVTSRDRVIVNPNGLLREGDRVSVRQRS